MSTTRCDCAAICGRSPTREVQNPLERVVTREAQAKGALVELTPRLPYPLFGIGYGADARRRPIYGYLQGSEEDALYDFGPIVLHLSSSVAERTTVTIGDTLWQTDNGTLPCLAPTPLANPTDAALHTDSDFAGAEHARRLLRRTPLPTAGNAGSDLRFATTATCNGDSHSRENHGHARCLPSMKKRPCPHRA